MEQWLNGCFISSDECPTEADVFERERWAKVAISVDGGWLAFCTQDAADHWSEQQ